MEGIDLKIEVLLEYFFVFTIFLLLFLLLFICAISSEIKFSSSQTGRDNIRPTSLWFIMCKTCLVQALKDYLSSIAYIVTFLIQDEE